VINTLIFVAAKESELSPDAKVIILFVKELTSLVLNISCKALESWLPVNNELTTLLVNDTLGLTIIGFGIKYDVIALKSS
jgi:hypothetical protein